MAARDRTTQSYAQIPFANAADQAAFATRRRFRIFELDQRVLATLSSVLEAESQRWTCARATDLVGAGAQIRKTIADRDEDGNEP